MKNFFITLPKNIKTIFSGRYLWLHAAFITLTAAIVISDFDWTWYITTRSDTLRFLLFPAIILGGLLPLILPLLIYVWGRVKKSTKIVNTAYAIAQAEFLGLLISSTYKAFTGRAHPEFFSGTMPVDISQVFQFGFLKGGVFWGWPSSHTTVAFALALCLVSLYPKSKLIRFSAIPYAFYVGFGVSISIHWFSDFIAGAILGSLIGLVVGKSFQKFDII